MIRSMTFPRAPGLIWIKWRRFKVHMISTLRASPKIDRKAFMEPTRRLWIQLAIVFVISFAALGWLGRQIYLAAPPIPTVVAVGGQTLYTADEIRDGQRAWLAAGGQQL